MKKVKLKGVLKKPEKISFIKKSYLRLVCEAVVILMLAGYLFYNSIFAGFVFFPYIYWHVKHRRKEIIQKEKNEIKRAFRDGMQAVVSALMAGYSLENSFREALGEIKLIYGDKSPIYKGFAEIVRKISININIEDAMGLFAAEYDIEEINCFSEILYYAKRSGGNLVEIIKNTVTTISEKIEVENEIQTVISAKKFEQKIMNVVPVGMILYMRLTSGEMFGKLYGNVFGIFIMTGCLILYFIARIIAYRIIDIRM